MSKYFDGELLSGYEKSPKTTIFGEEHFIDTQMIKFVEQRNNAIDNYVLEQMNNAIKGTLFVEMPKVEINKEKLKKWVVLCSKLENIEHSELVDMATKKRIAELEAKLAESEESHHKNIVELTKIATEKDRKIEEMKHQLAETITFAPIIKNNLELVKKIICLDKDGIDFIEQHNQAKTDFAIEKLEKVKELCKKKFDWWENSEWEGDIYDKSDVSNAYFDIEANIDEQINKLKEKK